MRSFSSLNPCGRRGATNRGIFMNAIRLLAVTGACACALSCLATFAADAPAKADQKFMTKAAGGGIYEVEVSKMAAAKAKKSGRQGLRGDAGQGPHRGQRRAEAARFQQGRGAARRTCRPTRRPRWTSCRGPATSTATSSSEVGLDDHKTDIALFEKASKNAKDAECEGLVRQDLADPEGATGQRRRSSAAAASMAMKH